MRAALYARYSTDNQSDTSVEDQLVLCRRFAEKVGARVVHEYSDAAISGQAIGNRPGVRALVEAARRGEAIWSSPSTLTACRARQRRLGDLRRPEIARRALRHRQPG
jgi:DNA invertase Pin-like site-specific DNA recombinase